MKSSVVIVVAAAMMTLAGPAAADSGVFVDDDGRPGEQSLEWLAERGVIHGCDPPANLRVCPDDELTRAQAAKILVLLGRTEGLMAEDRPGTIDHFHDDDGVWNGAAEGFIDHLADLRVVHGCDPPDNRSFCPYRPLLRGQITKMAVQAFGLEAPTHYQTPWHDTHDHFFHEAARVAAFHALFDSSAGVFGGYEPVTRAEFAQLVVRVFGGELCPDDPFSSARTAGLEQAHPGVRFTAYAFDIQTGCAYGMNPRSRQETASVFKVMVMGGTLLEAQSEGRPLTSDEQSWLDSMITQSANSPVRDVWRSFGGAPWFSRQAEIFQLGETHVVGDYQPVWGRTTTSAYDQGDLLRQVLLGEGGLLDAASREMAFDFMNSVVASQTWGVTRGVPDEWTVAQKNGFAGQTANSVGVVYDEAGKPVYVVSILTFGWPDWEDGVAPVEQIAGWVSDALAG